MSDITIISKSWEDTNCIPGIVFFQNNNINIFGMMTNKLHTKSTDSILLTSMYLNIHNKVQCNILQLERTRNPCFWKSFMTYKKIKKSNPKIRVGYTLPS